MLHEQTLLQAVLERGRRRRPVIGAHRGASARAPENTLGAFRAALEDGAELIELDVHLTRDGALAVLHDPTTDRTTGQRGVVAALSMVQLRALDAGRHRGSRWVGEAVPELGDIFQLARGKMWVNVEIKSGAATVPVLARRMTEHDMMGSTIVSSFDPAAVRAASATRPPLLAGLLLDRLPSDPVAAAREVGASLLHVEHGRITGALVEAAHRAGLGVVAWTVNDPTEMRRLHGLGVDAILSDDPRLLREVVGRDSPPAMEGTRV